MSAVIDNARFNLTPNIAGLIPMVSSTDVVGEIPFPFPSTETALLLTIGIPDFQLKIDLPIVDMEFSKQEGICEFKLALVPDALFNISLYVERNQEEDTFRVRQISVNHELLTNRALPEFVALTFRALFSLANLVSIYIPDANLSISTSFDYPLKEISRMLQNRQLAYRVMVIEKALDIDIELPPNDISGEEVGTIAYAYHSIVERTFDWQCNSVSYSIPANQESLNWLPPSKKLSPTEFPPMPIVKTLFGRELYLGRSIGRIENSVIENYQDVKRELSLLDGHLVNLVIRPLDGRMRIETLDAPHLPEYPWEERIQQLIDLDLQLSEKLANRHHALVAVTLDGLTEERKLAITARPELDETAFLVED